jgi:hypothetical protein
MCIAAAGCGGGSDHGSERVEAIGQGSVNARCGQAIGGTGVRNWRDGATAVGRVGFWGPGRDFRNAQEVTRGFLRASHPLPSSGPILLTKVPVVVEGSKPVDVAIAPADRARAGLGLAIQGGPYAEVRFVPCRHRPQTFWPGGWVLRDREAVRVLVKDDGRPPSQVLVGGVL